MEASVIIPTYKRSRFLADALKSLGCQDCPREFFEVVVVDNAETPTQELKDLCNESSEFTLRYVHEGNNGLHNARHAGAREARGDILVFIDDDVICPAGWLSAIVAPFDDAQVAMVAGKVALRHESPPPEWLEQFSSALSALDLGDTPHVIAPNGIAAGCNMAVRKKALFDVGGFNPDGFGNRNLIRYRGDGECGLARKFHDAKLGVWYSPEAVLEHRVPESRMTVEYGGRRAEDSGIEAVYQIYRYRLRHSAPLVGFGLTFTAKSLCHFALKWRTTRKSSAWFRHHVSSQQHFHSVVQCGRLMCSKKLRAHTKAPTYLR